MSNLGLRLLSLIIAILLSIFVNSENNITTAQITVGVEVRDLPADKVIIWQLKKQVDVEVRGPSFLVSRLASSPPTLRVKLPEETGARFIAQINKSDFDIEPPLQVVSISPPEISFTIEKKITKEVPVKVPRIGQLKADLRLNDIKTSPDSVIVVGPESEIKELQSVMTAPVDLKEIRGAESFELPLRIPGKQTELSQNAVKVQIDAHALDVPKSFERVPVELRMSARDGFRVAPETVSIRVIGIRDVVQDLQPSSIIPYVRVTPEIAQTAQELPVQVEVPQGVTVVSIEPKTVHIISETAKRKGK